MYRKKRAIIIFLTAMLVFSPVTLVGVQVFEAAETKAVTKGENYNKVKEDYGISTVYEISGSGDVTTELVNYLDKNCKNLTEKVMIYFPSGEYTIKDDNNLVLHSHVCIVAEDDTVIKMTGSEKSMLRTRKDEKVTDVLIYGGTWNGDKKGNHIFELNAATGVEIKNVTLEKANKNGVMVSNGSECAMKDVEIKNCENNGVQVTSTSTANITDSKISKNGKFGIGVDSESNITVKDTEVNSNTKNGISASGSSVVKVEGGKFNSNSGHGISVSEGSSLDIKKATISKNKQYGISVADSKLNENTTGKQSNKITENAWSGISATGKDTKIIVNNNTITGNGADPKESDDGVVGHGIGVAESATAEIKDNTISNNSQCGVSVFDGAVVKMKNNTVSENGRHGIGGRKNVDLDIYGEDTVIENNGYGEAEEYAGNGILIADESYAKLSGITIKGNKGMGLSVVDKSEVMMKNTTVAENIDSNISITQGDEEKTGSKVTLQDKNVINGSENGHGIVVSNKGKIIITGEKNKIKYNALSGISVSGKSTLEIEQKTYVEENGENGIYVKGSGTKATIKNAVVKTNSKYGIAVDKEATVTIDNATVEANKSYGISIREKGTTVTLTNSRIKKNENTGIMVNSGASLETTNNVKVESNEGNGIYVKGSTATLDNVKVKNNTKYGITIEKGSIVTVQGKSVAEKNGSYGINITGEGTTATVKKTTIKNNGKNGIMVNSKATVEELYNNTVSDNGETGICIKEESTVKKIQKNTITGHSKYGIAIYDSKASKVKNNKLSNPDGKNEIYVKDADTNVSKMSVVTIDKVKTSSTKVKGTATANCDITITGGDKDYTGTVKKNGEYSVKISKQEKDKTLKVTVEDKNGNETYNSIKVK